MNNKNLIKTILALFVLVVLLGGAYLVSSRSGETKNNVTQNDTTKGTSESTPTSTQQKEDNANTKSDLKPAYDFELKDLDGNTVKLSDYKGKVVFVNFWATWCPPCKSELPEFNEANKEFEQKEDVVLLAVNLTTGGFRGETEDVVRKFINDNGYTIKVLLDKSGGVANQYGIHSVPTTYIIDKNGDVYDSHIGIMNKAQLMGFYDELK